LIISITFSTPPVEPVGFFAIDFVPVLSSCVTPANLCAEVRSRQENQGHPA
jgi:hypothetical protein